MIKANIYKIGLLLSVLLFLIFFYESLHYSIRTSLHYNPKSQYVGFLIIEYFYISIVVFSPSILLLILSIFFRNLIRSKHLSALCLHLLLLAASTGYAYTVNEMIHTL